MVEAAAVAEQRLGIELPQPAREVGGRTRATASPPRPPASARPRPGRTGAPPGSAARSGRGCGRCRSRCRGRSDPACVQLGDQPVAAEQVEPPGQVVDTLCGRYIRSMRRRMSSAGSAQAVAISRRAGRGGSRRRSRSGPGRAARASGFPRRSRARAGRAAASAAGSSPSPAVRKMTLAPGRAVRLICSHKAAIRGPAHPVLRIEQDVGVHAPLVLPAQEAGHGRLLDVDPRRALPQRREVLRPQIGRQPPPAPG